jgi:hypothetical protein
LGNDFSEVMYTAFRVEQIWSTLIGDMIKSGGEAVDDGIDFENCSANSMKFSSLLISGQVYMGWRTSKVTGALVLYSSLGGWVISGSIAGEVSACDVVSDLPYADANIG